MKRCDKSEDIGELNFFARLVWVVLIVGVCILPMAVPYTNPLIPDFWGFRPEEKAVTTWIVGFLGIFGLISTLILFYRATCKFKSKQVASFLL